MKPGKNFSGLMLIIAAACIGLALIFLPGWIIGHYETISTFGSWAGTAYLIAVGVGAALLLGSTIWTVWKLWGASIAKQRKRARRNRNPSELSNSQKDYEIDENLKQVGELRERAGNDPELAKQLDPLLKEIEYKRESKELEIVAFGTISSGSRQY